MIIRAVTFDLDDTLWPFPPIGERIEQRLHEWLEQHAPRTADLFPIHRMRQLRHQVDLEHPQHAHDLSMLRRLTIERALAESGEDTALTDAAFEVFYSERNKVDFYPDALDAVRRIARLYPIASLSNGNADLERIGLMPPFRHAVSATQMGVAKPDARLFHAACALLECEPSQVLHVGDHIDMDVIGALDAGMQAAWVNRLGETWPSAHPSPTFTCTELSALADWLESHATSSI